MHYEARKNRIRSLTDGGSIKYGLLNRVTGCTFHGGGNSTAYSLPGDRFGAGEHNN